MHKVNPFEAISYRIPRPVSEICCFNGPFGMEAYPICPHCGMTMEREYQAYCDRCGQALDWRSFSRATVCH